MPIRALIGTSLTAVIGIALGVVGTLLVLLRHRKPGDPVSELRNAGGL